jgi:hypothetical protein
VGKDVANGRLSLLCQGDIILSVGMIALIKEFNFAERRGGFTGDWTGRKLLAIKENLQPNMVQFRFGFPTRWLGGFALRRRDLSFDGRRLRTRCRGRNFQGFACANQIAP